MKEESFDKKDWLVIIAVALGYYVDAFDIIIFSVLKDPSFKDLGVDINNNLNYGLYVLYFQLTGLVVGGVLFGKIGDKLGRRNTLFASILVYSLVTLINAFITDIYQYAICRFFAGIGLGGEFVGIAYLLEKLNQKNRTIGMVYFATAGMLGAVSGGIAGAFLEWRLCYIIGAILGFALLIIRYGTTESELYSFQKKSLNTNSFGSIRYIFSNEILRRKYILSILTGGSLFVCVGLFIQGTQSFAKYFGLYSVNSEGNIEYLVKGSWAVVFYYLGAAPAEIIAGFLRKKFKSGKKPMRIYYFFQVFTIIFFCFNFSHTPGEYYFKCFLLGFSLGYWVLFLAQSAEQFGTNIRATSSTSIPNFARAMAIPYTLFVPFLIDKGFDFIITSCVIGIASVVIAWYSMEKLDETYNKDLNYIDK